MKQRQKEKVEGKRDRAVAVKSTVLRRYFELNVSLTNLNQADRDVVGQCLHAAVEGPFFPDWEFHTLFGLQRSEVRTVLSAWPDIDESNESVRLAINNSLGNLVGYPHGCELQWSEFISASPADVSRIFNVWREPYNKTLDRSHGKR